MNSRTSARTPVSARVPSTPTIAPPSSTSLHSIAAARRAARVPPWPLARSRATIERPIPARVSFRLFQHDLVDSTNERALAAIASGAARHGDVHVAAGQSAGRGRLGRSWASAPGEGLYLSLVLLPAEAPRPAALTMGAGLAVLAAVHALGVTSARLKWPNDVLVEGAKLAGILIEGRMVEARGLDPARPHAVVGVGLNVRQREFPSALEAERALTSLARLGLELTLEEVRSTLLARLEPRLTQACCEPAGVVRDYALALGLVGRRVLVRAGRGEARGRLRALTLDGLELESDEGERSRHPLEHVQALESRE